MNSVSACCVCGQAIDDTNPTLLFQGQDCVRHHLCRDCHSALYRLTIAQDESEVDMAISAVEQRMTAATDEVLDYVHGVFDTYARGTPRIVAAQEDEAPDEEDAPICSGAKGFRDELSASLRNASLRLRRLMRIPGRDTALTRVVTLSGAAFFLVLLIALPVLLTRLGFGTLWAVLIGAVTSVHWLSRSVLTARRGGRWEQKWDEKENNRR